MTEVASKLKWVIKININIHQHSLSFQQELCQLQNELSPEIKHPCEPVVYIGLYLKNVLL